MIKTLKIYEKFPCDRPDSIRGVAGEEGYTMGRGDFNDENLFKRYETCPGGPNKCLY